MAQAKELEGIRRNRGGWREVGFRVFWWFGDRRLSGGLENQLERALKFFGEEIHGLERDGFFGGGGWWGGALL